MSAATPPTAHLALFIKSLSGGGAQRALLNLAGAWAERGHRVDLLVARASGRFVEQIPPGVRLIDLATPSYFALLGGLARHPRILWPLLAPLVVANPPLVLGAIPALTRYLEKEAPDGLLAALNYSSITAITARRLAGVSTRVVVSEQNMLSLRTAAENKRRMWVLPRLIRRFYPMADTVIAASEGVADEIARISRIPRDNILTVYNPVISPEILERSREPADHAWLGEGAIAPVVVAVGRLVEQKDMATLLNAFRRVRDRRVARLLILGDGPERERLEAQVARLGLANDVALPGFVDNPYAVMARAQLFVLSSAWEGFGNVLAEAMACGCPVVSTDCPSGPREILEDGHYGPLVAVGDAPALADAMIRVLDSPPTERDLRARAQAFSVEAIAEKTLELLLGVRQTRATNSA